MAKLDNPAARLHALLSAYVANAQDNRSIQQTWAMVLDIEPRTVSIALCEVAELLPAIESAIEASGGDQLRDTWIQFAPSWAVPITTPEHHTRQNPSPGAGLVDKAALVALGTVSTVLSLTRSEGDTPTDDALVQIRQYIEEAIQEATNANDLAPELRAALVNRLHDILWALDRVRIGGPGAIEAAMERLVGLVAVHNRGRKPRGAASRVLALVGKAWVAFKFGDEASTALEGWENILGELPGPGD